MAKVIINYDFRSLYYNILLHIMAFAAELRSTILPQRMKKVRLRQNIQ